MEAAANSKMHMSSPSEFDDQVNLINHQILKNLLDMIVVGMRPRLRQKQTKMKRPTFHQVQ